MTAVLDHRRVPALLRERPFQRYWSGQTVSLFGDQISLVALPLVAILGLKAGRPSFCSVRRPGCT